MSKKMSSAFFKKVTRGFACDFSLYLCFPKAMQIAIFIHSNKLVVCQNEFCNRVRTNRNAFSLSSVFRFNINKLNMMFGQ
jgi:hypothetical protein